MADPQAILVALLQEIDVPASLAQAEIVPGAAAENQLIGDRVLHMDNLQAMAQLPDASLDFVYLDPPFASDTTYYHDIRLPGHTIRHEAYRDTWPDGIGSYLAFLVPRLAAVRRLLKPTGSICVHLDRHSSHYVKLALDAIFGRDLLINELIWRYGKMSNTSRRFPQSHDTLLVYGASAGWYFAPVRSAPSEYRARFVRDLTGNRVLYGTVKHRQDKLIIRRATARARELGRTLRDDDVLWDFDAERKVQDDVFTDISIVRGNAREGTGYDTQKPQRLLERLIAAYCPPGGRVGDFFCGSGTTCGAARVLQRSFILADTSLAAIQTSRLRLPHATFARDARLQPPTFVVNAAGEIVDFRLDDLQLSSADHAAVVRTLAESAAVLIAGRINATIIDVFGREATLPG